jgi:hypothetical protein
VNYASSFWRVSVVSLASHLEAWLKLEHAFTSENIRNDGNAELQYGLCDMEGARQETP